MILQESNRTWAKSEIIASSRYDGDLAALTLLMRLGVREAAWASLNIYSTKQEIDALLDGLSAARRNA